MTSKPGVNRYPGISLEDTCLLPRRRPVQRRRDLSFRLLYGTWEPVVPMSREKLKGADPPEGESTEAEHRGGAARSSEEDPVMGLERRDCTVWFQPQDQLE